MFSERKKIVFKIGTSSLAHETGRANIRHMSQLVAALSDIHNSGIQVVLVTSGAIGVGAGKMGLTSKPQDTPGRQAAATVGQCELMFMYDKLFGEYGHTVGQLLITKADTEDPERAENLSNAFEKLFEFGIIPIINENDAVAVEEIVFGDNDCLSAVVARLIHADRLVIITDTDGLFDKDPREHADAKLITKISEITDETEKIAGGTGSGFATGGMLTKIHAAKIAREAGIDTVIINGIPAGNIYDAAEGKEVGTLFIGKKDG